MRVCHLPYDAGSELERSCHVQRPQQLRSQRPKGNSVLRQVQDTRVVLRGSFWALCLGIMRRLKQLQPQIWYMPRHFCQRCEVVVMVSRRLSVAGLEKNTSPSRAALVLSRSSITRWKVIWLIRNRMELLQPFGSEVHLQLDETRHAVVH
jgi:hypothetical protein